METDIGSGTLHEDFDMGFYYVSFVSGILFAIYFLIAALIIVKVCGTQGWVRNCLLTLAFIAPWTEEIWIAYNFGQFCGKDAGLFVYKTSEVDGFYDDTTSWGPRQLSKSGYRFVESRDHIQGKLLRVERADDASRDKALAWYAAQPKGKETSFIQYRGSDTEQIDVAPNGVDAWRTTTISKPTAQYHYKNSHEPIQYQIKRYENSVVDTTSGMVLARYTDYSRGAFWFFLSLDRPVKTCEKTKEGLRQYGTLSVYRLSLLPYTSQLKEKQ